MEPIFFKCTALSDIVINASTNTEGNMESLDFIPGSNFWGIVASQLHQSNDADVMDVMAICHSEQVMFGDALPFVNNEKFYKMPFSYMTGKNDTDKKDKYLNFLVADKEVKDEKNVKIQLKQMRSGYLSPSGKFIDCIAKSFALKSAHDATKRGSKEGAMFGFESIVEGTEFVMSIKSKNETFLQKVTDILNGKKHRVGKSKNAQYGQVKIEKIEKSKLIEQFTPKDYTLIYAESNLCFIDETTGQFTFQPTAAQLGLSAGQIDFGLSSIRTYSYSPWNAKRNTTDPQRHCIAAGSVFYVNTTNVTQAENVVGVFKTEGMGRILYNPIFLEGDADTYKLKFEILDSKKDNTNKPKKEIPEFIGTSPLAKRLNSFRASEKREIDIAKEVYHNTNAEHQFIKVTPSQWGLIRSEVTKAESYQGLIKKLFESPTEDEIKQGLKTKGLLMYGVAADRIWNEGGLNKKLEEFFNKNANQSTEFVAKFAAEMAKKAQKVKQNDK